MSEHTELPPDSVAVIGMAGRFPGAPGIESLWTLLTEHREAIRRLTDDELAASHPNYDALRDDPSFIKAFGVLDDIDLFDARFFNMTPREAAQLDPQQRIFLECAWESLERAGYAPDRYDGAVGVYAGCSPSTYILHSLMASRAHVEEYVLGMWGEMLHVMLSGEKDFMPTRTAFKLNLRGPAVSVQTACSTSLVAIVQAYHSLLRYETDMCLAGGSSIAVPQQRGYMYQEGAIGSRDGHCRPFDADAQGTVFGSGVACVVLKRLEDAVADGDHVHAVIRGAAINNDGAGKLAFAAPSGEGQAQVIAMAQAVAGVPIESITYVEAHGTATPLGDPIEIAGLTRAFRAKTSRTQYCGIGSIKGNIGHLDVTSGAAGFIKAALALENELIPGTVNYDRPNPEIEFERTPFFVVKDATPWKRGSVPRRAGVSAFGIGGTNAHVVLEEAPLRRPSGESRPVQLLPLSAKSSDALAHAAERLRDHLLEHRDASLADVAFTLSCGRAEHEHRRVIVARTVDEAIAALGDDSAPARAATRDTGGIAFMFPGQGAQYVNMGRELYDTEPTFRKHVDAGAEVLKPILGIDIRDLMYPAEDAESTAAEGLKQTEVTQPALFIVSYALAKQWEEWGITPDAMIGHSVGEYVAACLAGVFSFEDAVRILAERARLMQDQATGSMIAVRLPAAEVEPRLTGALSLAAANAPSLCVVSGPDDEVSAFARSLEESGASVTRLHTSHAYHSVMMEPALEPFAKAVAGVKLNAPTRRWVSSLTGDWVTAEQAVDPVYWASQLRRTVRFSEGVQQLIDSGIRFYVEVGPGNTLSTFTLQHAGARGAVVAPTLAHPRQDATALETMLLALGRMWAAGGVIDWSRIFAGQTRLRVILPTYPFERKRHWIDAPAVGSVRESKPAGETRRGSGAAADGVPTRTVYLDGAISASADGAAVGDRATLRANAILRRTLELSSDLSGMPIDEIQPRQTFLEMGFDSLFLTQAIGRLHGEFGVTIRFRQLFDELGSPQLLAEHIARVLPDDAFAGAAGAVAEPASAVAEAASAVPIAVAQPSPRAVSATPPTPDARLGRDPQGNPAWYRPDPDRPGKYIRVGE